MDPSRLSIACARFDGFRAAIIAACRAGSDWTSAQFDYIESYLRGDASARTLVIETPYVDRHYLEEYGAYYFSALRNGGPTTTRIHFFDIEFDRAQLGDWARDASAAEGSSHGAIQARLDEAYIGFMTVRPLPGAPIGRTILRPYRDKPARSYIPSEGGHRVHLMGFELTARGLPFQQQEQAVGACATTAIWSAMSRVARVDGGRAPTPYAVTQAATRHYVQDRPLPALGGLELAQLTAAVREFGYAPYVLKPQGEVATFFLSLKCYLRSGIPAVLVIHEGAGGHHAVAASGVRLGDDEEPAEDIRVVPDRGSELRSKGISRIYVHDDRFGPYLRMQLAPPSTAGHEPRLVRVPQRAPDPAGGAGGQIWYAMFPLYPKLRMTARELIGVGVETLPMVRHLLNADERERLNADIFFAHGSTYQRELMRLGVEDPRRVERFVSEVALSRYVGVVRFQLDDRALVDIVCDTTDIQREHPANASVLAVFPFASKHVAAFQSAVMPWTIVV